MTLPTSLKRPMPSTTPLWVMALMELSMALGIHTTAMGTSLYLVTLRNQSYLFWCSYDFEWQSIVPSIMVFDKTTDPSSPNLIGELRLRRDGKTPLFFFWFEHF